MVAVPAAVMRVFGTVTVTAVADELVTVRFTMVLPLIHWTVGAPPMFRFVPLSVTLIVGPPATAPFGFNDVIVGGETILKLTEFELIGVRPAR